MASCKIEVREYMNALIHIATGFGVAGAVTDMKKVKTKKDIVKVLASLNEY